MIKNYFTIAWRSFQRHRLFSLINISGLAIGISASLVIYLIVQHEFSYDNFHKDGDRMYRVVSKIEFPDLTINSSGTPVPTGPAIRSEVTGVESVTHFFTANELKVEVPIPGNQTPATFRHQKNIVFADSLYFSFFDYPWIAGSSRAALYAPFQVVLTEDRAKTYFASLAPKDIVGREIIYDDSIKVTVAGIVGQIGKPTDFTFQEFISRSTVEHTGIRQQWDWDEWGSINSNSQLFVKLQPGIKPAQIEKQLVSVREHHRTHHPERSEKDDTEHFLQPIRDIHFNADYDTFDQRIGHKPTLYGLLAVASFLLILGCINFINLTTAQAAQRAREVGIRKTMGSGVWQLIGQFLMETFMLTCLATLLSVLITPWLLTVFSDFIPPEISFSSLNQPHVWLFLLALIIVVTILSGLYPAFVLTRFQPVTVLKNQAFAGTAQTRKAWLRKTLTVTQFVIAQFLIIAMLVVSKQVHYSLTKDLGYKKDAIVFFRTRWNFFSAAPDNRRLTLLQELKAIPDIERVSLSDSPPASNSTSSSTIKYKGGKQPFESMVELKYADTSYFALYGLKLLAGRNLYQSDTTKEFVINATFAKMLGFKRPEEAIGQVLERNGNVPITGVVADFHTKSTHQAIKPLAYSSATSRSYVLHLALKPQGNDPDRWKNTLAKVEKAYKALYPEDEFSYEFYDKSIANFYKTEQDVSRLLKWSAGLCIFISCLGLLGLVMFITATRTKEIGVRKVLGASVAQIVGLLSKDFLALVLIAFLIALPIAWWAMHHWLEDFVYRTTLSWWVFAVTGAGMLLLAMLILSIKTIKSAIENPVRSLRTE